VLVHHTWPMSSIVRSISSFPWWQCRWWWRPTDGPLAAAAAPRKRNRKSTMVEQGPRSQISIGSCTMSCYDIELGAVFLLERSDRHCNARSNEDRHSRRESSTTSAGGSAKASRCPPTQQVSMMDLQNKYRGALTRERFCRRDG
jgi:hypothetical protein